MILIALPPNHPEIRIWIKTNHSSRLIKLCDVIYCQACRNYCYLYLTDHNRIMVSQCLSVICRLLSSYGFVPVHKSYLVNVQHICNFTSNGDYKMLLSNNVTILLSKRLKKYLHDYLESFSSDTPESKTVCPYRNTTG